jgi:hypothetical protein
MTTAEQTEGGGAVRLACACQRRNADGTSNRRLRGILVCFVCFVVKICVICVICVICGFSVFRFEL